MNDLKNLLSPVLISLLVFVIGILDYWSGPRVDFGVVYLIPVLVAATLGRGLGLIIALASASTALLVDVSLGRDYPNALYYVWDFGSHSAIFSLVCLLRSYLIQARLQERELARTDPLTGAMNVRAFYEEAEIEIYRAGRYNHPLTMAYIDVDNFKTINDTFGHREGDRLLCAVVTTIRSRARLTDTVARLGGDEFALLMPEINEESAQIAMSKIQGELLREMQQNQWPATFSVGVLTCSATPPRSQELVKMADRLMYAVKSGSKNAIKYSTYVG